MYSPEIDGTAVCEGDMDVDPEFGEYRLTAVVSPVEFNVARATFGIRPMPNPIAGAMQGLVHCTGSLRQPVFSGVINCIQPTEEMFQSMEDTNAKTALNSLPGAVGAFDKVTSTHRLHKSIRRTSRLSMFETDPVQLRESALHTRYGNRCFHGA